MAITTKTPPRTQKQSEKRCEEPEIHPFEDAQDAWFWFISAQEARNDGARFVSGAGLYNRPCEPLDILKALDGLYRSRRLMRDHLLVLRFYGRRRLPPDPYRVKEARGAQLWKEAMDILSPVFERKGIIKPQGEDREARLWAAERLF